MEERGVWLDEEGGVWLDAEAACDVKVCIFPPHEQAKKPSPFSASAIYAPARLLSTIPYFQACLSEPWRKAETAPPSSSPRREIVLECADPCSPSDYRKCLLFLAPEEPVQMSVDAAIQLLRAADHLLYQDCADVCMAYLASEPWSDKEEEIIDHAISSMGLKPSSDLAARLSFADDMKVVKEVITRLTEKAVSGENNAAALCNFVKVTFKEASTQAACVCISVIKDAWTTCTSNLINGCQPQSITFWCMLTILLLDYGDAERLLAEFIESSKKLCNSLTFTRERVNLAEVLIQLFLRAVPSKVNKKLVLLSNSQRGTLLASWAPMVEDLDCRSLEAAFKQVFTTLPLQDPAVVALIKEEASKPYFEGCYAWWRTKLFKRMKRCANVHKETDWEVSNSSIKRVKLM